MEYCSFEEVEGYELLYNTAELLLLRGFNTETGGIEYRWAANRVQEVIQGVRDEACALTFVPREWLPAFESAGFHVRNAWHDYFLASLEAIGDEESAAELLTERDCGMVSEVTLSCRGRSRGFSGQTVAWVKAWLSGADDSVRNPAILAHKVENGRIAGIVCTGVYGYGSEKGPVAWIREVAVRPEYQNRGIARGLIRQALSYGKKHGAARAFLATDECNENAIHLYRSLGFQPSGEDSQIDVCNE